MGVYEVKIILMIIFVILTILMTWGIIEDIKEYYIRKKRCD